MKPSSRNVVLGIDPGLATTGWGVVEKTAGGLQLHGLGVIETSSSLPLSQRLLTLRHAVARLLDQYRPTAVSIEELFFTKFATSIAGTAQARGVILVTIEEAGVPVHEQNPRSMKMATTGFGSASKVQIQTAIQRQFKLASLPTPDDAADAVAMALCFLQTAQSLSVPATTRRARAQWEAKLLAMSEAKS